MPTLVNQAHNSGLFVFAAVAPTLAYDHASLLGEDISIPLEKAKQLGIPALVMSGSASNPFMGKTAAKLSSAIPGAKLLTLEGQTHNVSPEALAPLLINFFNA